MKKYIDFVKDNISIFTILPLLIGGLWQILALASISTAYLRFFSATQLIADGLLVLFVLFICYLSWLAYSFGIKKTNKFHENPTWQKGLTLLVSFSVSLYYTLDFFVYFFREQYFKYKIDLISLVLLVFCFLLLGSLLISIFIFLHSWGESEKWGFLKSSWFNRIIQFFSFIIVGTALVFLFFILSLFPRFHKTYALPSDLKNLDYLKSKVGKSVPTDSINVRYFNDKFIFIEVRNGEKSYIQVFQFEDLFDSNK